MRNEISIKFRMYLSTSLRNISALVVVLMLSLMATAQVVVPVGGVTPTLTAVNINSGAGDQYDPHVSGDFAAYTSDLSIRYYNFATGSDAAIPLGNSARDLLSDISGSKIVFSRVITGVKTTVMVFDASTPFLLPIEIDPATNVTRIGTAIGGNTVAYMDFTLESHGELVIHDLVTSTSTRITNDNAYDANPSVSPDGTVVTWEHCATSSSNCDIWQAVKTGAVWNVGVVSDSTDPEANPDTNGSLVVYDSTRAGNSDIYWRSVTGGAEAKLQMSGFEANPNIAGNIISFESRPTLFDTTDIFVYDIDTNRLYNITNTPLVTEQLNEISVLPGGRVRVVWTSDEDGFDQRNVKGATFSFQPTFSNGKIVYTNGGDIWKMDPDGSNRQQVIDAGTNDVQPEWSPDGSKIVFKSDRDIPPGRGLYVVNADGTGLTLLTNAGINDSDSYPTWSPDGSRIAFASNRDNLISSIYIMNADGSNVTRLTSQLPYSDQNPEWSPDGTKVVFETNQGLCACIGVVNVDGTGRAVIGSGQYPSWSPDGTKIIFALLDGTGYHIYTMKPDGTDLTQLTFGAPNDHYPSFSPDGRKIVFMRNTSGTVGLWTMNADGSGQVIFPGTNTIGPGHSDWQRGPALQPDADDDGVPDGTDNCPTTPNPNQENNDGDALGDVCDADDDNDGQTDADEIACDSDPLSAASRAPDNDGDNSPDCVDIDDDNDGQTDADEIACGSDPLSAASRAPDNDGDNRPDCVDPDDDNDGILDGVDNCQFTANPNQANNDGDALGDVCDPDDDNDGVLDGVDNCPFTANANQANNDGDAFGDACDPDDDNDGVLDTTDNCPFNANPTQTDTDNDGIGDVCDTAPAVTTAYGTIAPSNGGWAIFGVVNNSGTLTGAITYSRGNVFFFATRITSFVISGQTATMEGFSTNGRLFVSRIRDGGAGQPDNFRLWIDGVEQTSSTGALTSGNVVINPWAADTRLKGWVDLHTHPMSNVAFGGKLFYGAPSVGSLMPAVQMPSDPQCRFDDRATNIAEALSQDGPTRGDPIQSQCGDFIRRGLINALEVANNAAAAPVGSGGYPNFTHWPRWNDITHQKMWIDWIRRSWQGGQRVMVALSHNNRTLAELLGGGGPISGVRYDKASSDLQIEEIKTLVAANSDFMAVARTPAELHNIVQSGRLAVVLGVEIDKIGDFNTNAPPSTQAIDNEISRLYSQGVRYILPVHLTDNAFGDTAIYQPLFNIVNWRENGSFWTVGCSPEADEIGFRSLNFPSVLNPFIPPGMPSPQTAPNCQIIKPTGPFFLGHVNARTTNGLTSVGEYTIRALMRRGIIIDIDHMSNRAANRTLSIANGIAGGGYPVMSGHSGIRGRLLEKRDAENSRTTAQLARIACLGGMFGLGTDGIRAVDWTTEYARGYDIMRRAFAPNGLCPSADPLGGTSFLGLGTDANSLVMSPRPTMTETTTPRFSVIYNPNDPLNQGVPPLIRSSTGTRTWDYNSDGVAHYGMFLDFLRDVRTLPASVTMNGREIVDDQIMYGAERFYRMWLKSDAQKVRVP